MKNSEKDLKSQRMRFAKGWCRNSNTYIANCGLLNNDHVLEYELFETVVLSKQFHWLLKL